MDGGPICTMHTEPGHWISNLHNLLLASGQMILFSVSLHKSSPRSNLTLARLMVGTRMDHHPSIQESSLREGHPLLPRTAFITSMYIWTRTGHVSVQPHTKPYVVVEINEEIEDILLVAFNNALTITRMANGLFSET